MSDANKDPRDKYPAQRTSSEAQSLRAQHELSTAAVDGLILASINLERRNLRILDSGTADGYFLIDVNNEVLSKSTRNSAELIGTDIASYPPSDDPSANVKLSKQNFFEP